MQYKIGPTLFKRIFAPAALPPLHNLLNLWAIEDDALIGLDLQMSFVYEMIPPDLLIKSDQELVDYFQAFKNVLHSLPDDVTLQFLVRVGPGDKGKIEQYQDLIRPEGDIERLIVNSKVEHLQKTFVQNRRYYVCFTTMPDSAELGKLKPKSFGLMQTNFRKTTEALHNRRISQLKELTQNILNGLSAIGITVRHLKEAEILSLLYSYLNPGRSSLLSPKAYDRHTTLRAQICLNACENNFDNIYLDGFYYRAVNLHIRPESIDFLMLDKMLSQVMPASDISFSISTASQEQLIKKVHLTGSIARNIANLSGFKKNYEADAQSLDSQELIENVKTTFQKLYYYTFTVIVKERTLEKLTASANAVVQAFRSLGESEGIIDDMNHLPLYLSILPGHSHLNYRQHIFHSEAVSQMLPVFSEWKGCKQPYILFQTDDDQLLPVDLFDPSLSAKHGLVLGQTGSGKSFTTNFLLTNFYTASEKNHIVIIDVGGSYRKLCSLFEGQYLEIELSEAFAFNPFPSKEVAVINNSNEYFEVDADVISFLTHLVQKMLKIDELSGKDQKIFENAITDCYKCSKQDPPLLSSLHYQLMNYRGDDDDRRIAKEYGKNLEIWTTGRYGKLLNRNSTLTVNSRLVVFDLQKLGEQPELQSIVFFLISSVIEGKLKDLSLKKMIVIDEGWKFFNDTVGSLLIENLYRTARKFNAGIYSISQSPADFLNTKASNSIISNTYIKYILRLKSGYELLNQFGLNAQEIEKVKCLRSEKGRFSEVFLKFNEHSRVIKIEPSPVDYWICTTDPDDSQKEKAYRSAHSGHTEAQVLEGLAKGDLK
jgi:conjugal transfer ATP-binding protein TraC